MLLGALHAILVDGVRPECNLRFVWQRAEENPLTQSGGDWMANDGHVADDVDLVFGLHVWATGKPGVFYSRPEAFLGNSGRLKITIKCQGGHVASPDKGVNAIRIAHAVMLVMDQFNATSLPPYEPRTIEPAYISAGSAQASNVMPGQVEMWVGVRTMLPGEKHGEYLEQLEREITHEVAAFPGAKVSFGQVLGHPATINTAEQVASVSSLLMEIGESYEEHPPILGGEDFAYYLRKRPGAFFMLGTQTEGGGDHHAPTFNPDESVLWKGVLYWLLLAIR
jgi:amidohydrolase